MSEREGENDCIPNDIQPTVDDIKEEATSTNDDVTEIRASTGVIPFDLESADVDNTDAPLDSVTTSTALTTNGEYAVIVVSSDLIDSVQAIGFIFLMGFSHELLEFKKNTAYEIRTLRWFVGLNCDKLFM